MISLYGRYIQKNPSKPILKVWVQRYNSRGCATVERRLKALPQSRALKTHKLDNVCPGEVKPVIPTPPVSVTPSPTPTTVNTGGTPSATSGSAPTAPAVQSSGVITTSTSHQNHTVSAIPSTPAPTTTPAPAKAPAPAPAPTPPVSTPQSQDLLWSNPATWGGTVPSASTEVIIPAGKRIVLDVSATVKNILVLGTLELKDTPLQLTTDYIMVHGTLRAGKSDAPFMSKAIITLRGSNTENVMDMGSRGILVMGGKLELYGNSPKVPWTKLADHALLGTQSLSLLANTSWATGDQIVIAPTDFYNDGQFQKSPETERLEVVSVNGTTLTLKTPLK